MSQETNSLIGGMEKVIDATAPIADAVPAHDVAPAESIAAGGEDAGQLKNAQGASETDTSKAFTHEEVRKLLEKAKTDWSEEAKKAGEVPKGSEIERQAAKIAALELQIIASGLKDSALEKLSTAKLPASLAKLLSYSSEEAMQASYDTVTEIFGTEIGAVIDSRLRGKTPDGIGSANNDAATIATQIRKSVRGE